MTVPILARVAIATVLLGGGGYLGYKVLEDPQNQFFGPTISSGPKQERVVALTFDDGPNPPYTDRILRVLRDEHVHATFFLVGRAVVAYPDTVRRIVRDGNVVGNHSWDHEHLLVHSRRSEDGELARTDAAIFRIAGVHTTLMRPPFGARDFAVIDEARKKGYRVVMWSVPLPKDWEQPGDMKIAQRVLDHVSPGSIIVLHDGNRGLVCGGKIPASVCDRTQDVAATRIIIEKLHASGYRFVTIPELVAAPQRTSDRRERSQAYRRPPHSM